jgi:aminoglycoside 6'-N-acetyltransferase I
LEVQIKELAADEDSLIGEVAAMLIEGFRQSAPDAFPDLQTAIAEVRESFAADRVTRVAVDDHAEAVGWIGGISHYKGHAWELHPLVIRPDRPGRGIGRALVSDFEQRVVECGGRTIFLGTDDEQGQTSIGGVDLYPDVWNHVRTIRNLRLHPYQFYQKLGFVIVGVIPDANGFGKPDIFMAKRVGRG